MTLPQVYRLFGYWEKNPPEHEAIAIALRVYTTWGREASRPPTVEEQRKSLEARWNAGALNPKQLLEIFGDQPIKLDGAAAPSLH